MAVAPSSGASTATEVSGTGSGGMVVVVVDVVVGGRVGQQHRVVVLRHGLVGLGEQAVALLDLRRFAAEREQHEADAARDFVRSDSTICPMASVWSEALIRLKISGSRSTVMTPLGHVGRHGSGPAR